MVSWPPCSPLIGQYAANWSPSYSIMQENILHHGCGYTLWYLEPTVRSALELETNLHGDYAKFYNLGPTSAFTFKTLIRHFAK